MTASRSELGLLTDWSVFVTEDGDCVPRTWASVRDGLMPWSALDDDELFKGLLRNYSGTFQGQRRPCPPELLRGLTSEVHRRLEERMRDRVGDVLDTIHDISNGTIVGTAADQLKASTYVLERVIGKVPERVQLDAVVRPWEGLVQGILVDDPSAALGPPALDAAEADTP